MTHSAKPTTPPEHRPANFEPIEPAQVALTRPAQPTRETTPAGPAWHRRHRTALLITLCGMLVLAVIFVLPNLIQPPVVAPSPPVTTTSDVTTEGTDSPYAQAQRAQARRAAQDVLAQLIDKQQLLESKHVQLWGMADYQAALELAHQGDAAYRQQNFAVALQQYTDAVGQLQALEQSFEPYVEATLATGNAALNTGDGDAALGAFTKILAIDPAHQHALSGKRRAELLPEVHALTLQGQQQQSAGDLAAARDSFAQALAIDPLHAPAQNGRQETAARLNERDFSNAMGQGYSELQRGSYRAALTAFERAAALRPNAPETISGIAQARNHLAQDQLGRELTRAAQLEQVEQWADAEHIYTQILSRDDSLIDARIGQIRTSARAALDTRLQKTLADPLRLAGDADYQRAQRLLADARNVAAPGTRLQGQISALATVLKTAAIPVVVSLQSDNQTEVALFKVGDLGKFREKTLRLKPGRYVAEGIRPGYRDVRVEFAVTHQGVPAPIAIQCQEPI